MTRLGRCLALVAAVTVVALSLAGGATLAEGASLAPDATSAPGAASCLLDTEPNDTPETAADLTAPGCVAGSLPAGDQDLFIWTVGDADAQQAWDITMAGIDNTVTGAKFLPITSAPSETPAVVGTQILEVAQAPTDTDSQTVRGLRFPAGRYLIGISRSATADGGEPLDDSYQLTIERGPPLPLNGDTEPNDDIGSASPVSGEFAVSGDLRDSADTYRWTTPALALDGAWRLDLDSPLTFGAQLYLEDPDGTTLMTVTPDALGHAELADLSLPPGEHILVITPSASIAAPYVLSATQGPLSGADPEPNSVLAAASPLDPTRPVVRGRLAAEDTSDWYTLDIDDALAARLLDIRLIWRTGPARQLCLVTADGTPLQCRSGDAGVALSGLRLPVGRVGLQVSGDPDDLSPYVLRVDQTTVPSTDFEAEPNDDPSLATPMSGMTMRGLLGDNDRDAFQVTTTGQAQLWQVDVTGHGIGGLLWMRPDGTQLAVGDVALDHTSAQVTDAYLIPGDHWIRVDGSDGDYTVALTPLGPPDPNSEREPNNDSLDAEPYVIGSVRTGRLPGMADADVFRFTIATPDHVRVTVSPPVSGGLDMRLVSGSFRATTIRDIHDVPMAYDALLQPGDYELWLTTSAPSTDRYTMTVDREDPFTLPVDQEPNDEIADAAPVPASLHIEGDGPPSGDTDWYQLRPLPAGGDLAFRMSGSVDRLIVSDGVTDYEGVVADDGSDTITDLPATTPLWLRVDTQGSYTVDILPGGTGLHAPVPDPAPPSVSLTLSTDQPAIAAFWASGQVATGDLAVASTGAADQRLTLDSATSDPGWSLQFEATQVDLPPGATVHVPVSVRVLPDAIVDDAVQLTVRARDASGGQVTGVAEMAADADVAPVDPGQAWSVPDILLGGLDVASAALGGAPVVSIDPTEEAELYDGVTPSGSGFQTTMSGTPITLTVDLAGDAPVPVAGMGLDPLAGRQSNDPVPKAVTLLLSDDGTTWQEALSGQLSPLDRDQWFPLPSPIPARFAQLRIDSTWGGTDGPVALGEWKVVAAPGAAPDPMPANIAEPVRGGHVVWMDPPASSQDVADSLLTDDPTEYPDSLYASASDTQTFVVGFQDDREALLTGMEWVDPSPTDPSKQMRSVQVEISTLSPVGPWQPVGTWKLDRSDDGTVVPFAFDDPTWARFVRMTGSPIRKDAYSQEEPATVRILEAPTDSAYRSILGEWGDALPVGPREWTQPPETGVAADEDDGDDTPETARELVPGRTAAGRVHRDQDVDWYRVTIPDGQNSISISVGGVPAVGVALTLFSPDGQTVPMTFAATEDGSVRYEANVTSGATYRVRVTQPPFSAVFTFDTSGSMGPYLPFVTQAMRAYTGGVTTGDEAVEVIPFEEDPLLPDWSDDPYLLQDAVDRYVLGGGSSGAEAALIDASDQLAGREGARAVLLVTDADTSSYAKVQELWQDLASVRPMVFAVHVGADAVPVQSRHFMQDWAAAGGGHYQYVASHGEMDQAFSRMATWLRRPAGYTLDTTTSEVELPPPPPGSLSVVAVDANGEPAPAPVSKDVAIDIILDTSGSMLDRFGGKSRIDSAKQVLSDLVTDQLPPGTPVALRILGSRSDPCGTSLAVPFGPLDAASMVGLVDRLTVDRAADTPIGAAFEAVPKDLASATGARIVLLITDSKEIWPNKDLCSRDPAAAIRAIQRQGIEARISIVGLAVDDKQARRQMARWARLGGGAFFDARQRSQLDDAIRTAVSAPYEVYDQTGTLVGTGAVGGQPLHLPPGTYRVVVLSEPPTTYEGIVVESDGSVTVTLPSTEPRAVRTPEPGTSPAPDASPAQPGASAAP